MPAPHPLAAVTMRLVRDEPTRRTRRIRSRRRWLRRRGWTTVTQVAPTEIRADDGAAWEVITPTEAFEAVRDALKKASIEPASAELSMVPQSYVKLTGSQASQMMRLVEALEEHDDVQHVYSNFDVDEAELKAAVGAE